VASSFDGLFGRLKENAVDCDALDLAVFGEVLEASPALQELRERGSSVLKVFPRLMEDVFNALYKMSPELVPREKLSPAVWFNRAEMEKLLSNPEFQQLREYTQLDDAVAAVGSRAFLEEIAERLEREKALRDAAQAANEACECVERLREQAAPEQVPPPDEGPPDGDGGARMPDAPEQVSPPDESAPGGNAGAGLAGGPEGSPLPGRPQGGAPDGGAQEAERLLAQAEAAGARAEACLNAARTSLRRAVAAGVERALGDVEKVRAALVSWGVEPGVLREMPVERKLELFDRLAKVDKFRRMTELVGRMKNLALAAQRAKLDRLRVELVGVELGGDLARALPQELVLLRRPALKALFYRRWLERQLLQYELTLKEKAGRGPIICLVDGSGSMGTLHGHCTRDDWAKALALGLLQAAKAEGRDFAAAVFGARQQLACWEFPGGKVRPEDALDFAARSFGGGTDFETPLSWALEKVRESRYSRADVVIVTDGECRVSEEFRKELLRLKEEKEFAVYALLVGLSRSELERWADRVWAVEDLLDDRAPRELFAAV
jgi:uncharacterized protein with von Willebrand factor type A (vWA) domain